MEILPVYPKFSTISHSMAALPMVPKKINKKGGRQTGNSVYITGLAQDITIREIPTPSYFTFSTMPIPMAILSI